MATPEPTLRDYWRFLIKRRLIVALTTVVVVVAVYIFTMLQPRVYQTESLVMINERRAVQELLAQVLTVSTRTLSTEAFLIKSTKVLRAAALKAGLIKPQDDPGHVMQMLAFLDRAIVTATNDQAGTITVRVIGSDQRLITDLANAVSQVYVAENRDQEQRDVREARKYIEDQLARQEALLVVCEKRLQAFKETAGITDMTIELTSALGRANTVRAQIELLEAQRQALDRRLREGGGQNPGLDEGVSRLRGEMAGLKYQRLMQLEGPAARTPRHPEVVRLDAQMAAKQEEMETRVRQLAGQMRTQQAMALMELEAQLEAYRRVQERLDADLARMPRHEIRLAQLNRELSRQQQIVASYSQRLEEARILEAGRIGSASVIREANLPTVPIKPNRKLNLMVGLVAGLLLGVVFGFLVESLDTSIRDIEEVERLVGAPVIGVLSPILPPETVPPGPALSHLLITAHDPKSPISEAYRTLRTNLYFGALRQGRRTFLVDSGMPQEGKSVTCANLAVALAQAGTRTVLLECNLRRPSQHRYFNLDPAFGVTDILVADLPIEEALKRTPIPNLQIITSGPIPPNPSELLSSPRMRELMAELARRFEAVVVDCAPVIPVTDGQILAEIVDRVILVHQPGKSGRDTLARARSLLTAAGGTLQGVVLNNVVSTTLITSYYQIPGLKYVQADYRDAQVPPPDPDIKA